MASKQAPMLLMSPHTFFRSLTYSADARICKGVWYVCMYVRKYLFGECMQVPLPPQSAPPQSVSRSCTRKRKIERQRDRADSG